jgi:ribonuclease BN (tRNA processing enzyme)
MTVVGSSGSIPGAGSPGSCYLVEHDGFRLVIDLGNGALGALQQHVALSQIDAIVLSHLHADHCIDLTALYVAHRYGPYEFDGRVPVFGPTDTAERMAQVYGMTSHSGMSGTFDFRDLASAASIGPFRIRADRVAHPVEAYGVRLTAGDASLVYTGDTGPCRSVDQLAAGADVLLAEASFVHGEENPRDLHLTGREAGELADQAGVGRLVLTHVPPWNDPAVAHAEASAVYDGPIDLATPRLVVDVGERSGNGEGRVSR